MKRILALLCLVLIVAPLGARAESVRGLPGVLTGDIAGGLKLGAAIGIVLEAGDQDRHRRRDDGGDDDNNNNGQRQRGNDFNRRDDNDGGGRREDRNDNRMSRAYAIASQRGRVIDVWPEGGSIFGARVSSTDRGRIELRIDVDSGRVEER